MTSRFDIRRLAPTLIAAALATIYVIVSPPSFDLAAHLLRAKLFRAEGFGLWNNWWYAGHHTLGYSVLFPPLEALLSPQLTAGLACVGTAAVFERLAYNHFGPDSWVGSAWFGAATASNLFTGRLAFAFGMLPALGSMLALQHRRSGLASGCAALSALASPVAALFATLGGAAYAIGSFLDGRSSAGADRRSVGRSFKRERAGLYVIASAVIPVLLLSVAFPEGGTEPFTLATLWPIVLAAAVALAALPRRETVLRVGVVLYALGTIGAYAISTPVGSNAARLGALIAGPLAALLWFPRHPRWLLAAVLPLAYLQWQAPVRDVSRSANDPSVSASYYRPVLAFLRRQPGPPFRIEIPFTKFHWETYDVAPYFPLARGWERQLDIKYNHLFYGGPLTPATYQAWLSSLAVRYVAVSDARPDFSSTRETALIDSGLRYLRLVLRTAHWRVYAVLHPTSIVEGPATLKRLGADSLTIAVTRPGPMRVRVRFTPYWSIEHGAGCVRPEGDFTALDVRRPGTIKLAISFAPDRIGARSPRCT